MVGIGGNKEEHSHLTSRKYLLLLDLRHLPQGGNGGPCLWPVAKSSWLRNPCHHDRLTQFGLLGWMKRLKKSCSIHGHGVLTKTQPQP
jgi:hypothetical protein